MNDFRLNFIHLCDEATFSQEGKLSLIGIFDVVNLVNIPGNLLKAVLVCNFSILNPPIKDVKVNIVITKKGEKEPVFSIPTLTAKLPANKQMKNSDEAGKIGLTIQLGNLTFNSEGTYILNVNVNENLLGTYKFDVKRMSPKGVAS